MNISILKGFTLIIFLCAVVSVYAHAVPRQIIISLTPTGFEPTQVTISQNTEVVFENTDMRDRWPASNIHPTHEIYPEFDPKQPITTGQKWKFTFGKIGTWKFHDHLFPQFSGQVVVIGSQSQKSQTVADNQSKNQDAFILRLKLTLAKIYYKIFPQQLTKSFNKINLHEIADNPLQLRYWLELVGSEKAMNKLIQISRNGSLVDCHQEAHQVGRLAFEIFGADIFKHSYFECHSGFIHGAMEAFLKQQGTQNLERDIVSLCDQLPSSFTKFECLHGMGHGVMAFVNYDMTEALQMCKQLENGFAKSSCYGGVFMENILVAQGKGATPGHTTNWVNDDPHFPCIAVDQDPSIQYECYMMQTSRMLEIGQYDFNFVVQECRKAPANFREVCYKSMGRDVAGKTLREPQKIINLCQTADSGYFDNCIYGGLNVIIDFWGENLHDQASKLCKLLPENHKTNCYQTLAGRITGIFVNNESRQLVCDTFEENYRTLCLSD